MGCKTVILFDGPVGVGKTSLGRAVAARMGLGFVDGDAQAVPGDWLRSGLRTARANVCVVQSTLDVHTGAILSYPLRRTNWLYYRLRFQRLGYGVVSIGLTAELDAITNRARKLRPEEVARSREMIAQGYGTRPFHDRILRTDRGSFDDTVARLVTTLADLTAPQRRR